MRKQAKSDEKVQKPSTHYDEPNEVVSDSSLSLEEKIKTLDTLEQDARQLADASSEGMGGGERGKLHEILIAGKALDRPPATDADVGSPPHSRRSKVNPGIVERPERNLQRELNTRPASHAPKSPKREVKRQPRADMSQKK
jgi:hypothetical protein